jgi:hypothetical protein
VTGVWRSPSASGDLHSLAWNGMERSVQRRDRSPRGGLS